MNRGFWFLAGAGAGVYAMIRGRRAAEAFTAEGIADRVGALALGARMLRDEVAQGMAEAEPELRRRIGARGPDTPALASREGSEGYSSTELEQSTEGTKEQEGTT